MSDSQQDPPVTYNKDWYDSLSQYRPWNERAMWAAFAHLGRPASFADFGCGDGWMVRTARMIGTKPTIGVENGDPPRIDWAKIVKYDLSTPLHLGRRYDLVVSIEVGEHIPECFADVYVSNLARHTDKWLVFTAAAPGQGGNGHINCQSQEYWRRKLEALDLIYRTDTTEQLRETWKWATGPMFWLPQNLQVFHRNMEYWP